MARIEDEIGRIADPVLRATLLDEVKKLKSHKKFGLVFEEHRPELVPIYSAKVKARSLVARRGRTFTETFNVVRVYEHIADVEKSDGSRETIPVDELIVVRRFGEPIYPALRPLDHVRNGETSQPHHILIDADNYHALQFLEYCYSGKVDCIYIDPPYNTGARDWKYNNDYVDSNDTWRHSKWLAFMEKRLKLAKRLLNPDSSVLIVTIDEKEYSRLGLLLDQIFAECKVQMISSLINPASVARAGAFGRSDEYIFFVTMGGAVPQRLRLSREWVSGKGRTHTGNIRWDLLRRSGEGAARKDAPGCFYPIYVNPHGPTVERVGAPLPSGQSIPEPLEGLIPVLPIRKDGSEGRWQWAPGTFRERLIQGRVRITGSEKRGFVVSILKDGEFAKIERGEFQEVGRNPDGSILVEDVDTDFVLAVPSSQWRISSHDATQYGSRLLGDILHGRKFPFPKSVYAVRDAIRFFVESKPNAMVLDFFAGSGTTLHAVNLLNAIDGGNRQCILVTNNEVSEDEAKMLAEQGHKPGSDEWNKHGICQSVTFPRSKFTMLGRRDDGTELEGEYLTGRTVKMEKLRTFKQLGFVEGRLLSLAQRKQLVALIDKVPQSKITNDMPFFVDAEIKASILFDIRHAEAWLEALELQEHITDFYLVTQDNKAFNSIKQQVQELLGPVLLEEEEKRPLRDGFSANLEYFKLDFLDPNEVQMGRQFAEIVPILWMMAGARGPLPDAPNPHAPWLIPNDCPFAVLVQEKRFKEFHRHVAERSDLTHVFIVTNSLETYQNLREELEVPQVVQLYKDYLENFKINFVKD